jgi:hypothetical protein
MYVPFILLRLPSHHQSANGLPSKLPLPLYVDPSNTWSYQTGLSLGTIPRDVSNASQLVFPILDNGCIDSTYDWQAPKDIPRSSSLPRFRPDWILSALLCASVAFLVL